MGVVQALTRTLNVASKKIQNLLCGKNRKADTDTSRESPHKMPNKASNKPGHELSVPHLDRHITGGGNELRVISPTHSRYTLCVTSW